MARRVLVTGASGFVGQEVCRVLTTDGFKVRAVSLRGDISDWSALVEGCFAIVHLAARTHVLRESAADPLAAYRKVNSDLTLDLADAAKDAGVERFVFMSTIAVNGVSRDTPFTEADTPQPESDYAVSKWEAEQRLGSLFADSSTALTVLRPPIVYGPHVKARFRQMVDWVARGIPLPLGTVANRRSFIGVRNLADAVSTVLAAPSASGTYLVADREVVSTPELLRMIAEALGVKSRLLPVPVAALRLGGRLLGQSESIERVVVSLSVDAGPFSRTFDWIPPHPMDAELAELAKWYRAQT